MAKLNIFKNKIFVSCLIIFIFFLIDRITKELVIRYVENNFDYEIFTSNYLNIILTWNDGIAFGLLSQNDSLIYNLISLLIFTIILVLVWMLKSNYGISFFALLLIIGGAVGNFYDRIINKSVPDFIDFHVGEFHWFVFNFADVFISIGVIIMIFIEIFFNKKPNE